MGSNQSDLGRSFEHCGRMIDSPAIKGTEALGSWLPLRGGIWQRHARVTVIISREEPSPTGITCTTFGSTGYSVCQVNYGIVTEESFCVHVSLLCLRDDKYQTHICGRQSPWQDIHIVGLSIKPLN